MEKKTKEILVPGDKYTVVGDSFDMELFEQIYGYLRAEQKVIKFPSEIGKHETFGAGGIGSIRLTCTAEKEFELSHPVDVRH